MKKPNQGYSYIELLVHMAVFSVLFAITFQFFIDIQSLSLKTQAHSAVSDNAKVALNHLTQAVRNADNISYPAIGNTASELRLNSDNLIYSIQDQKLVKTQSDQTDFITDNRAIVSDLSFTQLGDADITSVQISFTLNSANQYLNQAIRSQTFQTTIALY